MAASRCNSHKKYEKTCTLCRTRAREYRRLRVDSIRNGSWDRGWVTGEPLERVRAHVLRLLAHPDVRQWMVAAASGVGRSALAALLGRHTPRATGTVAGALAGVTLAACLRQIVNPNQIVSVVGSARRLQAMAVDEWGATEIAELCGMHPSLVRRHRHSSMQGGISWAHREQYRELYEKVQGMADPRGREVRARHNAEKLGWVGPEQWPDDSIDDPDAQPLPPLPEDDDWVAVTQQIEQALHRPSPGLAADYPRAIQREIAKRARAKDWTFEQIAELLGKKSAHTIEYMLNGRPDRPHTRGGR